MRSWKWILIGFFFVGWMTNLGSSDLWAARSDLIEKDLNKKKKDLKDVKKELSLTKEKEKKIKGKETSVLESLHVMEAELYKKEKELKRMDDQLARIREKVLKTKNQITALDEEMERTKEKLFSRLVAFYKMERIPPETFLLTSQSYLDLLRIDKFLRVIINFDTHLMNIFRYQVALNLRYQEELIQDQSQREQNISEVKGKKEEIEKVKKAKKTLLKSIQNQKVVYQKAIGELKESAKGLQTLISRLEREKTLFAYGKSNDEVIRAKLIPPVQGKVISLFKEKGQNGIEIKAPIRSEIRAVLPGKILYADWFKGFGNIVIINHGEHIVAIYGYASELLKKEGDTVSQGETIARVGSSGSLKGSCLYFEIRYRGEPQDPMRLIPQLDKVVFLPEGNEQGKK